MAADGTAYTAFVHQLAHGRWYAAVAHRHGKVYVDVEAKDTRPEVIAWLGQHYPGAFVQPCDCEANAAGVAAEGAPRVH